MPDNDILNAKGADLGDFDLPPLPTRPAKLVPDSDEPKKEVNVELPQMPAGAVKKPLDPEDNSPEISAPIPKVPKMPEKPAAYTQTETPKMPEKPAPAPEVPKMPERPAAMAADQAPRMPEKPSFMKDSVKPEETKQEKEAKEAKAADEKKTSERFVFDPHYNDAPIDPGSVKLAPMNSKAEMNARNKKEAQKMSSLANEIGNGPLLDDLSDEYKSYEAKTEDLKEKSKLDSDEKRILKQQLAADLGSRPKGFNARASQNLYNKLMEEKKLKISKKGFAISILPIFMGLGSAAICFFKMNWGSYQWFQFVAPFMVLAAVLLLIKSKHVKLLAVSIYAVCALIYVIPGLIFFTMQNSMEGENIVHIVFAILAVALNIISVLILIKNEAVNTYYSNNISKRK